MLPSEVESMSLPLIAPASPKHPEPLSLKGHRLRFSWKPTLLLALFAAHLASAAAHAQVTYTGTAANQNFGSVADGSTSAAKSFSFSVAAGTTVGSIGVLTTGVPNLDYANASGTTCTAKLYATAASCTVSVTVKPQYPGTRAGAVVFFSGAGDSGTVLGKVLLTGIGTGPEISFACNSAPFVTFTATAGGEGLNSPNGIAVDTAGNLYIADTGNSRVVKVPIGGGAGTAISATVNGLSLSGPVDLTLDGAGDLFIADTGNNRIVEIPVGGGASVAIAPIADSIGLEKPTGVAVDPTGDLYIVDQANNRVIEAPTGGGVATVVAIPEGYTLTAPARVALDSEGNLLISNHTVNNGVVAISRPGTTAPENIPNLDGLYPIGLAVDAAFDFWVVEDQSNAVEQAQGSGGGGCESTQAPGGVSMVDPQGVALDGAGDVFVADTGNDRIVEQINSRTPTGVTFSTPTEVGQVNTTLKTVRIQNVGNANLVFPGFPAASNPILSDDFLSYHNNSSGSCPSLAAGGSPAVLAPSIPCTFNIIFRPQSAGTVNGELVFTDNSLNAAGPSYSSQTIALTGTGTSNPAVVTSPSPGSVLGSSAAFQWTTPAGTSYSTITVTTATQQIYTSGQIPGNTLTVNNLPQLGQTLSVTLSVYAGGKSYGGTFNYQESGASLAGPAPGSTLTDSVATFSWGPVKTGTTYALNLGSTGVGSSNLYNSGHITGNSVTVSKLPVDGKPIYAELWVFIGNAWVTSHYTYSAAVMTTAALSSPAPGSTLGTTQTFAWTAATGATAYALNLGSTGVGSSNVYNSGHVTTTSTTASGLPTNGETIYAELWAYVNNAWVTTNYTFKAVDTVATITSPAPGSTLIGSAQTFTWTPAAGASIYALNLGSTGVGSSNLYNSGHITTTSVSVTGLPTNGEPIYAKLWAYVNNAWVTTDYNYTAK
jgi:sugar lactone lactonase YvrE